MAASATTLAGVLMSSVVGQEQQRLSPRGKPFERQKLSPGGESLFFACAKKSNQKKPLYSSRMADQAHPAAAPATRVRSADGIFGRGLSASQPSPGQSPRGASPPAGAKQCFAFSRRALPRPKTAHIPVRRPPAGGFARQLRRCGGDPVDQERNNSKNDGNRKSDRYGYGYGYGYSRFGFGSIVGRAVPLVVWGFAGLSSAARRPRLAVSAGRSFVMSAGASG
ncbi:hypothetical protein FHR66_001681 [Xanthomonas sp. F4]